jgi:hypothetical protein
MATDVRQLPRNDQAVLGAGVLAFIFSLIPVYYGITGAGPFNHSVNAWHGWNVLALLLILVATLIAAAQVFAASSVPEVPVSLNFVVAAACGLGTLILIIRSFTLDSESSGGASIGLRWGAYVLMILCVVQAVFAFLRLRESGDAMPWEGRSGATGGGDSAAPPPPPA